MKYLFLYSDTFPYAGVRPEQEALDAFSIIGDLATPTEAGEKLRTNSYDVVVNLHGRYVPKNSWKEILKYLRHGGGLVNIGGSPFQNPVSIRDGILIIEREQTAYHRDLNICNVFNNVFEVARFESSRSFDLNDRYNELFGCGSISEFTVKFSHTIDTPNEPGSSGRMEAVIHPLVNALTVDGRKVAAPVVLIENIRNTFAGGRWIFVNQDTTHSFWQNGGNDFIFKLVQMASQSASEVILRPGYASYYPGEQPALLLQYQLARAESNYHIAFDIVISKNGCEIFRWEHSDSISNDIAYRSIPVYFTVEAGYYEIRMIGEINGERRRYCSGFWGFDLELLESGSRMSASGDWFTKDGKVFPIKGMTYMASDVHRKFLFIPNPAVWMNDFSFMRDSGINLVRSGIWTSFRHIMYVDGIASEEVMRAIDAFILTARSYDIEVVFNLFAFLPESWDGINPYLDPLSIEAQKGFIRAIVSRHITTTNISWDLINEPSIFKVFCGLKPNGDQFELAAWRKWLKERYQTIEELQEKWNLSSDELVSFDDAMLPEDSDFAGVDGRDAIPNPPIRRTKSLIGLDYCLFANHVFDCWARGLAEAIWRIAPGQLVAVGQDHATASRKPHPLFHGRYLDYTSVHTWWLIDDIYWDSVFIKIPNKPALVQETGIMYVEDNNESSRRSEEETRNILERKLAYAFAANTAGVIPWLLNTNVYMDSMNEVHIGMLRPDMTEKPEYDAVRGIYGFIDRNMDKLGNAMQEDIAVIFSFSNSYSNRAYANIATRKCSRVLSFNLKKCFLGFSDNNLDMMDSSKLIIFPSPRVISSDLWSKLIKKADEGATVLITGPVNFDEHWSFVDRSLDICQQTVLTSVAREETVNIGGESFRAVFDGQLIGWVDKETVGEEEATLYIINKGKGRLLWCPLPIEMNREDDVIAEIYKTAISLAEIPNELEFTQDALNGIFVKKLCADGGIIYVVISEEGTDKRVEFTDQKTGANINLVVKAGRSVMLATTMDGKKIDSYGL